MSRARRAPIKTRPFAGKKRTRKNKTALKELKGNWEKKYIMEEEEEQQHQQQYIDNKPINQRITNRIRRKQKRETVFFYITERLLTMGINSKQSRRPNRWPARWRSNSRWIPAGRWTRAPAIRRCNWSRGHCRRRRLEAEVAGRATPRSRTFATTRATSDARCNIIIKQIQQLE